MKTIDVSSFKILKEKVDILVVDVREDFERRSGFIEESVHIPLGQLSLDTLPCQDKPIVFYCRSGMRSQVACQKINDVAKSIDVYSLTGGMNAWQKEQAPKTCTRKTGFSVERQTFFCAGLFVFLGVLMGVLYHPNFYYVSGFVGLGLMFAALTGFCGMSLFLARMPWNR